MLKKFECIYQTANNGKIALEILENDSNFDLIFMDCQMPIMDGIEATKFIRNSNKPYKNIPIIALTAGAFESGEETCKKAGMDGYLLKPIKLNQISETIQTFKKI